MLQERKLLLLLALTRWLDMFFMLQVDQLLLLLERWLEQLAILQEGQLQAASDSWGSRTGHTH
jgi:hypothetical protein